MIQFPLLAFNAIHLYLTKTPHQKTNKMNTTETTLKMIFDRWDALLKNFDKTLNELTDDNCNTKLLLARTVVFTCLAI